MVYKNQVTVAITLSSPGIAIDSILARMVHAAVKSAPEGLGIQSLAKDLGGSVQTESALGWSIMCLVNRRGLGKAKHVNVQHLWIQDVSKSETADLMMKPLIKLMGYAIRIGGAHSNVQKEA